VTVSSRFTDKAHLASYAYGDQQRLADRGAIYRFLRIDHRELGPFPVRGDGLVGVVSTHLDPAMAGAALDIGCGRGQHLPLLAGQCRTVVAADLSRGMLEATPTGPWVKIVADVERLPFIDAGFDVILANHMLYHAPDVGSAVSELRRVLRPGGTLLATTNADGNFSELYELLAEAASMVLGRRVERLTPADERFTVESGSKRLAERFSDVSIRRTSGQLVIDSDESLDALRAYYRSTDDEWSSRYDIDWRVFEPALEQVLVERMRTAGEIRITTSSGILMAT
jgi:SAM-dependent methyltransferase